MARPRRVGFIGLGIMGAPMAANLVRAGFELAVETRTREKVERSATSREEAATCPPCSRAHASARSRVRLKTVIS